MIVGVRVLVACGAGVGVFVGACVAVGPEIARDTSLDHVALPPPVYLPTLNT